MVLLTPNRYKRGANLGAALSREVALCNRQADGGVSLSSLLMIYTQISLLPYSQDSQVAGMGSTKKIY